MVEAIFPNNKKDAKEANKKAHSQTSEFLCACS